jgi:hypothetical protein
MLSTSIPIILRDWLMTGYTLHIHMVTFVH